MREILFRGKAINRDYGYHKTSYYKNGDWVYGLVTRLYDERFENLPAEMTNVNGIEGIEVDYKTIGQYTGLTDKNGKKIFEGDIIQFCTGMKLHYIVEFGLGGFMVSRYDIRDAIINVYNCPCEVIGNIHDNPELLKEGDDK